MNPLIRAWLRDPLLHLIAGGALLFALYAAFGEGSADDTVGAEPARPTIDRVIVVDAPLRQRLTREFQRRFGRNPTDRDLETQITKFADDEMLFREGQARGMSDGDAVIRQRLIQKMRLLLDENTLAKAPTPQEVTAFYRANQARYPRPATTSFRHVYAQVIPAGLLERLQAGTASPERSGQPFARGLVFRRLPEVKIASIFGAPFVASLAKAPLNTWSGPVASSYGQHLLFVSARQPSGTMPLARVRKRVVRDMRDKLRASSASLTELRRRFEVVRR